MFGKAHVSDNHELVCSCQPSTYNGGRPFWSEVAVCQPGSFPQSSGTWGLPSYFLLSTFPYLEKVPGPGGLTLPESCL